MYLPLQVCLPPYTNENKTLLSSTSYTTLRQNRHSNNRAPELWHKASQPHRKQEAPKQLTKLGTTFTHSSTHSVLLSRAKGHEHKNRAFSQSEKLICYLCSGKTREEMGKVLMPQIMKYVILFRYEVVWKVKVAVIQ